MCNRSIVSVSTGCVRAALALGMLLAVNEGSLRLRKSCPLNAPCNNQTDADGFPKCICNTGSNINRNGICTPGACENADSESFPDPNPIKQLNVTEIGIRLITLAWEEPTGPYTHFEVQYFIDAYQAQKEIQNLTTKELGITVRSLRPHTRYAFSVAVVAERAGLRSKKSHAITVVVKTREEPPAPRQFRVGAAQNSTLSLRWQFDPSEVNGMLRHFLLEYGSLNNPTRNTTFLFPPTARGCSVPGLVPGDAYWFSVRAETDEGEGAAALLDWHVDNKAPREVHHSSSTVAVSFRTDYFSPANKSVTYTLVLAEELRNNVPARLPSWRDVHALDIWPPYQVTEPQNSTHSSSVEEFTIGSERCDAGGRSYCNGPLKPGTKYFIKLRIYITPIDFIDTGYTVIYTDPNPIKQLKVREIGIRLITLAWDEPAGPYTHFEVQYFIDAYQAQKEIQNLTTKELSITVRSLRPHTRYAFSVAVVAECAGLWSKKSHAITVVVKTREEPPVPRKFRVVAAQANTLSFSWQLDPSEVNGMLRRFVLEYGSLNNPAQNTTISFPPTARGGSVSGLVLGDAYWFSVRVETDEGAGAAALLDWHVDNKAPREVHHSSSTVAVSFRTGYFSPANKSVTYTLVLAEELRNNVPARLPSWRDVHTLDIWPPYQVTEPHNFSHSSSVEEFTIGSERCDAGGRSYCNGPLKPGTKYFVKLRIYITPIDFIDTGYTIIYTDEETNYIMITILSVSATAVILLCIMAIKKRCWIKYQYPDTPQLPANEHTSPFYLNLLFRKECDKEIAKMEEQHYDEIDENVYEEIEPNDYEEIDQRTRRVV